MEEVNNPELRLKEKSHFYTKDNPIEDEIYLVLEEMDIDTGGAVAAHLNSINPGLTVCPKCHVDDFVHVESCEFNKRWTPEEED
jgi:hypothetical protein